MSLKKRIQKAHDKSLLLYEQADAVDVLLNRLQEQLYRLQPHQNTRRVRLQEEFDTNTDLLHRLEEEATQYDEEFERLQAQQRRKALKKASTEELVEILKPKSMGEALDEAISQDAVDAIDETGFAPSDKDHPKLNPESQAHYDWQETVAKAEEPFDWDKVVDEALALKAKLRKKRKKVKAREFKILVQIIEQVSEDQDISTRQVWKGTVVHDKTASLKGDIEMWAETIRPLAQEIAVDHAAAVHEYRENGTSPKNFQASQPS